MLRNLLAERLKLVVHSGERIMPVYALVVEKRGAKLQETAAASSDSSGCTGAKRAGPSTPRLQEHEIALPATSGQDGVPQVSEPKRTLRNKAFKISEILGATERAELTF